jgi:hypothetical protein
MPSSFAALAALLVPLAAGAPSFCDAPGWARVFEDDFDTLDTCVAEVPWLSLASLSLHPGFSLQLLSLQYLRPT